MSNYRALFRVLSCAFVFWVGSTFLFGGSAFEVQM